MINEVIAALNEQDARGWTRLHQACYRGDVNDVQGLLANGAKVTVRSYDEGETPFHVATRRYPYKLIPLFIREGINPNLQDLKGYTALHLVASGSMLPSMSHQMIHYLICYAGALTCIKTNKGEEPLHLAAKNEYSRPLSFMLQVGRAFIDAKDTLGSTPLHYAAKNRRFENIKLLLEKGASVDVENCLGETAYQCFKNSLEDGAGDYRVFVESEDEYRWQVSPSGISQEEEDEIKQIFGKYILKMKYLQSLEETVEGVELEEFEVVSCMAEIEEIKSTKVTEGFSLYEVVTQCNTPYYLRDTEVTRALETLFCKIENWNFRVRFPNYGLMLRNKFEMSKRSRFNRSLEAVDSAFFPVRKSCLQKVPQEVWRHILTYVSDDDLRNFHLSGKNYFLDFVCEKGIIWSIQSLCLPYPIQSYKDQGYKVSTYGSRTAVFFEAKINDTYRSPNNHLCRFSCH